MTPESATAEAFVSHLFSSMYFFFYPSQPTKELSLLCLLPFLKKSPGRSFQERNLIYFETGNKRLVMNVRREPVSRSVEEFCVWIFEMNHCEWKEPRGPFKKKCFDMKALDQERVGTPPPPHSSCPLMSLLSKAALFAAFRSA